MMLPGSETKQSKRTGEGVVVVSAAVVVVTDELATEDVVVFV